MAKKNKTDGIIPAKLSAAQIPVATASAIIATRGKPDFGVYRTELPFRVNQ
jgi:hypothetical protein